MRWGNPQIPAVFARYPIKCITFLCRSRVRASARFPSETAGEETHELMFPCGPGDHNKAALLLLSHFFPPLFVQELEAGRQQDSVGSPLPGRSPAPPLLLSRLLPCPWAAESDGRGRGEAANRVCGASGGEGASCRGARGMCHTLGLYAPTGRSPIETLPNHHPSRRGFQKNPQNPVAFHLLYSLRSFWTCQGLKSWRNLFVRVCPKSLTCRGLGESRRCCARSCHAAGHVLACH